MINEATLEKMTAMRLCGMARAFRQTMETGSQQNFTIDELVGHMVDCEWEDRYNRRLERLLKAARFRYQASIEQIDFAAKRNLDKNLVLRMSDCGWLKKKENIIVTGPTGVGKSFLACALGHQACFQGYKVRYFNARKLFSFLKICKADGTYAKEVGTIQQQHLLIVDDFGLEHLDKQDRLNLFEVIEDRHGVQSTIITSQLPVMHWHEIIGDKTIADAICDRLIHSAHRLEIDGPTMRKKTAKKLTKVGHLE